VHCPHPAGKSYVDIMAIDTHKEIYGKENQQLLSFNVTCKKI